MLDLFHACVIQACRWNWHYIDYKRVKTMAGLLTFAPIYDDLKKGITLCIENHCLGSAVTLIYSGIDVMASLCVPGSDTKATREDFVRWCERYIRFNSSDQPTGLDFYGARCALVHSLGIVSELSRKGQCRMIVHTLGGGPEIHTKEHIPNMIGVSIEALSREFFRGIDACIVDLFKDPARAADIEKRLAMLVDALPYRGSIPSASS